VTSSDDVSLVNAKVALTFSGARLQIAGGSHLQVTLQSADV